MPEKVKEEGGKDIERKLKKEKDVLPDEEKEKIRYRRKRETEAILEEKRKRRHERT